MGAVIGRVDHDRVVGDAEVVELFQKLADLAVMLHNPVRIFGERGQPGRAATLGAHMRAEMHAGRIHSDEEGLLCLYLAIHEILGSGRGFVVDRLHPRLGERAGIDHAPVGIGVDDAARSEALLELGIRRIGALLRLLLGIEVIEIAEEFVEAVIGRQVFVAVSEMVLAELAGRLAERLQRIPRS